MKRVLITGAAGFLGTHLVNSLTKIWEVFALYRTVRPHPLMFHDTHLITQLMGDVQDQQFIERILAEYEIDCVIHLAAQTQVSVGLSNPASVIGENVKGAISILEAARRQGTKRIIMASTDKVYGTKIGAYTEESGLNERTPYGVSKACLDMIAQTYIETFGMSVAITRCGNLYGPGHLNWSTLIPGTIRRMIRGEKTTLRFGGKATRDFLYYLDACSAYLTLMESRETGPFNFSGGNPITIAQVAAKIANLLEKPASLIEVVEGAVGEICYQALDCERAKSVLDWKPHVAFDEGLKETVRWYVDHLTTG